MVRVYNTRNVLEMPEEDKEKIKAAGVSLNVYSQSLASLGPSNGRAVGQFSGLCTRISKNHLPIPPSRLIEFIVDRTTGQSKQDFSMTLDAKKGQGKSYTSGYIAGRYAIEIADRLGQQPKDFFSLNNCALLEDTDGISRILETAEKHQVIIIDDAGTAIGSRDFAQQKNKNFNKILTVCRTKRWFVILNSPMATHLDLQVRELVDAAAHIYKPYHADGFNIYKVNSTESLIRFGKKKVIEKRYSFNNKKFDFYCAFSPDILDPFKGFTKKYDEQREEAANRMISDISAQEKERKEDLPKSERRKREATEKHGETIRKLMEEGKSFREIARKTGLSDYRMNQIIAELNLK